MLILESIIFFVVGFAVCYGALSWYQNRSNFSYLITTLKEDIANLQVQFARMCDKK